ncbi:MAG: VOC family protein [Roseiflexus sp.]|nr:VOC family protein [Roseiflexus sp.]
MTTDRLAETRDFYVDTLGLVLANFDEAFGVLALQLADGFILRFEARGPAEPSSIQFLGFELGSFEEVDRLHDELSGRVRIVEDLRARFASKKGPYGFIIEDPNGYRVKLFRYGSRHKPDAAG